MKAPGIPANEQERLEAVREYNLLDTLPEEDYDIITKLTASICDTPISLISLMDVDRQFLKSHHGVPFTETPRDISFCGHTIVSSDNIFIIEDARIDERFHDNPLVTEQNAVFYAGVPLVNPNGYILGTLCILDTKPRNLTEVQKEALIALSRQTINLFELRKQNIELRELQEELKFRNNELKNFAGVVSHDMKMPLANMIVTADILKKKYGSELDEQAAEYISYLKDSSFTLSEYIEGLLQHYESERTASKQYEKFDIQQLLEEIVELLNINLDCEIHFPEENIEIVCNRVALEQIFLNLIGNSLKYNDKDKIEIIIDCQRKDNLYEFTIQDNGMGIPEDKINDIFNLFSIVGNLDRHGKKGNGIGLSTVKRIINNLGGTIEVDSTVGQGTTFTFTILQES